MESAVFLPNYRLLAVSMLLLFNHFSKKVVGPSLVGQPFAAVPFIGPVKIFYGRERRLEVRGGYPGHPYRSLVVPGNDCHS